RCPRLGANELERLVTVDPRSWAHLRSAREHGRGLIFVSMHFGNFEMGGARIADEMPLNVIADELENERLMDILVTNRKHKNLHLLPPNGAVRQVLQALKRNEMVGLMMDLGPRAQELAHVEATFFGLPAKFPTIAANLARVSGAPIAEAVGTIAYLAAPRARAAVRANLAVVAPDRPRLARRVFINQVRGYLEIFQIPALDDKRLTAMVVVDGWDRFTRAHAQGKGVIFASAHLGPVALVGQILMARGFELTLPVESTESELMRAVNRARSARGLHLVPLDSPLGIHRALRH